MPKFVYIGTRFSRGPYRGESPEAVAATLGDAIRAAAKAAKITIDEARQDFLDNLKPW